MKSLVSLLVFLGWVILPLSMVASWLFSWKIFIGLCAIWLIAKWWLYSANIELENQGIWSIFSIRKQFGLTLRQPPTEAMKDFLNQLGEPRFVDMDIMPWTAKVEENFEDVRTEVLSYIDSSGDFSDAYNNYFLATGSFWKSRSIIGWGLVTTRNLPITLRLMTEIGATNCTISRLDPGHTINRHRGETNAFVRCHLPVLVPEPASQVMMDVGGELRHWVEGKLMGFIDINPHQAFNKTTKERIVLIFDVIRPKFSQYERQVRCHWLVHYSISVINESVVAIFGRMGLFLRIWDKFFTWVAEPPLRLLLWLYFRLLCVRLPFWFRLHRNTGFYF